MKTLMDENEDVSRAGREMLLPVIGVWSLELGNFQSLLLAPFLKTIEDILKVGFKVVHNICCHIVLSLVGQFFNFKRRAIVITRIINN